MNDRCEELKRNSRMVFDDTLVEATNDTSYENYCKGRAA